MDGYAGKILRIDLSKEKITTEPLSEKMCNEFIGGRGFVAKTLYQELPPDTEPFGENNLFIIATGPLSGHFLPASGKTHFGSKSPATGGYADSNMGGHFGPALKYAGFDMAVITGKSKTPSYVFIKDDIVEIRSADPYWGKGSLICEDMMKKDLGEDFQILTIGPAGEKMVKFACISHDFGRQAGRTGIGAVLGSKNIKAIAVKGTGAIPVFNVDKAFAKGKEAFQKVFQKPGFKGWTPEGTAGITDWVNEVGAFPAKNFQTSHIDHSHMINGKKVIEKLKITDKGCYCCPTPCGKYGHTRTSMGEAFMEGPEFETISLFGGSCMLKTIEEVAYANYLCDELGIDTISGASVAAFTIECFEKGLIPADEIGKEVKFGDLESIVYLLNLMSLKQNALGELLSQGVKTASENIGNGSEKFAIHVKGLEWTGYECRNAPSMMLAYMTADVGAHHNRAWVLGQDVVGAATNVHDLISAGTKGDKRPKAVISGKDSAQFVIDSQHTRPIFDLLGCCRLQLMELGFEVENYAELYSIITGKKITWDDLVKISEKVWNLTRMISAREIKNFGRAFDYPPARFYEEPTPSGPNKGYCICLKDLDELLDAYYTARGWDKNGIPTKRTLERVGLTHMI
ncbi:MAG: aldehyde ferredoxin oxidoreductase family protein [Proteobacteria bacterium]|nr:aldehyde ferredoxin oxidoreductase family protein [Pseudomonadota bacterium]MBU1583641.1 aldehyde ferredoxin oxidoreductase family protein [Pseudomonadota bacterium]MBU2453809.1 aldehyde ferredoxin oxidoreductase family protein [Pseudomonadota bacterium]MBU2629434.1 aldehyde ferredoxin oxidoreductase family protein [Pseudomonadota bacterium]